MWFHRHPTTADMQITDGTIRDKHGRELYLRGINVDGGAKAPAKPHFTTFHVGPEFFEGDTVSFVGRPFPLEEAHIHFDRIRSWGFDTIRYIYTWEAIEHAGPGKYDQEFIDYTLSTLKIAIGCGLKVFMDPHQDVWGRFSGGSGAPLWTYYAAGLDPHSFKDTRAALVQNVMDEPENMPKMLWPTNYYRLTCEVMFTLFFAGKRYAPKCVLDGVNIQDYLQSHMLAACMQLYKAIEHAGLFGNGVFAVESMNEPNIGLVGLKDLSTLPATQNLRLGPTPTAFQSILLGSGHAQPVDYYDFGSLGPRFRHTKTVDPNGVSAWVQTDKYDKHYGWTRSPEWKLGTCLWAQHGVWDPETKELLKPDYFAPDDPQLDHEQFFVKECFIPYWRSLYTEFRTKLPKDLFLLCQPPTLAIPPRLKDTDLLDERVIYAPHFYDGLTLMLKRWSSLWNVDSLGYLRGHYKLPVFALKLGEHAIRATMRRQLGIIAHEGHENFGDNTPILMSETGIPMDMNDKEPFINGNYTPQIKALDAVASALEQNLMHFTYWCYQGDNSNDRGDHWNHEDFSFCSTNGGDRAVEAFVRPAPVAVVGKIVKTQFRLGHNTYELVIDGRECTGVPTIVYMPRLHFKDPVIDITAGDVTQKGEYVEWMHPAGQHTLSVNVKEGCAIM